MSGALHTKLKCLIYLLKICHLSMQLQLSHRIVNTIANSSVTIDDAGCCVIMYMLF